MSDGGLPPENIGAHHILSLFRTSHGPRAMTSRSEKSGDAPPTKSASNLWKNAISVTRFASKLKRARAKSKEDLRDDAKHTETDHKPPAKDRDSKPDTPLPGKAGKHQNDNRLSGDKDGGGSSIPKDGGSGDPPRIASPKVTYPKSRKMFPDSRSCKDVTWVVVWGAMFVASTATIFGGIMMNSGDQLERSFSGVDVHGNVCGAEGQGNHLALTRVGPESMVRTVLHNYTSGDTIGKCVIRCYDGTGENCTMNDGDSKIVMIPSSEGPYGRCIPLDTDLSQEATSQLWLQSDAMPTMELWALWPGVALAWATASSAATTLRRFLPRPLTGSKRSMWGYTGMAVSGTGIFTGCAVLLWKVGSGTDVKPSTSIMMTCVFVVLSVIAVSVRVNLSRDTERHQCAWSTLCTILSVSSLECDPCDDVEGGPTARDAPSSEAAAILVGKIRMNAKYTCWVLGVYSVVWTVFVGRSFTLLAGEPRFGMLTVMFHSAVFLWTCALLLRVGRFMSSAMVAHWYFATYRFPEERPPAHRDSISVFFIPTAVVIGYTRKALGALVASAFFSVVTFPLTMYGSVMSFTAPIAFLPKRATAKALETVKIREGLKKPPVESRGGSPIGSGGGGSSSGGSESKDDAGPKTAEKGIERSPLHAALTEDTPSDADVWVAMTITSVGYATSMVDIHTQWAYVRQGTRMSTHAALRIDSMTKILPAAALGWGLGTALCGALSVGSLSFASLVCAVVAYSSAASVYDGPELVTRCMPILALMDAYLHDSLAWRAPDAMLALLELKEPIMEASDHDPPRRVRKRDRAKRAMKRAAGSAARKVGSIVH